MEQTPRTFTLPDTAAGRNATRLAVHTLGDPLHTDVRTPGTGYWSRDHLGSHLY